VDYVVFGVKEVHRVKNTSEVIDRIVVVTTSVSSKSSGLSGIERSANRRVFGASDGRGPRGWSTAGKVPSKNRGERVLKRFIAQRWRQSSVVLSEMNLEKGVQQMSTTTLQPVGQESPSSPLAYEASNSSAEERYGIGRDGMPFLPG